MSHLICLPLAMQKNYLPNRQEPKARCSSFKARRVVSLHLEMLSESDWLVCEYN